MLVEMREGGASPTRHGPKPYALHRIGSPERFTEFTDSGHRFRAKPPSLFTRCRGEPAQFAKVEACIMIARHHSPFSGNFREDHGIGAGPHLPPDPNETRRAPPPGPSWNRAGRAALAGSVTEGSAPKIAPLDRGRSRDRSSIRQTGQVHGTNSQRREFIARVRQ